MEGERQGVHQLRRIGIESAEQIAAVQGDVVVERDCSDPLGPVD